MNNSSPKASKKGCSPAGCGCATFVLLFPFCIILASAFAFAMGPMTCAIPNRCSPQEENAKGIISLIILFGGGFGIPITTGILVSKALQSKGR